MPEIFSLPVPLSWFNLFLISSHRGGYVDENYDAQGKCVFPYEGNLCNQCAQGYAKASARTITCELEFFSRRIRIW